MQWPIVKTVQNLNTSLNVKDKTMVLTPKDAVETFYNTDMDLLVIGNYVIYKTK